MLVLAPQAITTPFAAAYLPTRESTVPRFQSGPEIVYEIVLPVVKPISSSFTKPFQKCFYNHLHFHPDETTNCTRSDQSVTLA